MKINEKRKKEQIRKCLESTDFILSKQDFLNRLRVYFV